MSEETAEKERQTSQFKFQKFLKKSVVALVSDSHGNEFVKKRSAPEKLSKSVDSVAIRKAAQLLRNEYDCQRKVESHNVPKAHSFYFGDYNGRFEAYMTLEFIPPGINLAEGMAELDEESAFKALMTLTEALKDTHDAGILHHDVKPENVLLGMKGGYLADFGIAKMVNKDYTSEGLGLIYEFGTTQYLAPEQIDSIPGKQTDTYQLGRLIYFVATQGSADKTRQYTTDHPHEYKAPMPIEQVNPKIKDYKGLHDLINACMHEDIHKRPRLDSVLTELESYHEHFSLGRNRGKLFWR